MIVDCHSFYDNVPYIEYVDTDICIGADSYHTDQAIVGCLEKAIAAEGYKSSVNKPLSGALVPLKFYRTDDRVKSFMLEINKRIYMNNGITDEKKLPELQSMFYRMIKGVETLLAEAYGILEY
jgi:N-formylglutamate amidohydrolase